MGVALLCACATTHTDKLDVQGEQTSQREVVKSETHDQAPSVVVVEEFEPTTATPRGADAVVGPAPSPAGEHAVTGASARAAGTTMPAQLVLVKRTTITTGAVHDEQHVNAEGQSRSDARTQASSAATATPALPKIPLSCGLAGGVWIYIAVALALGGGVSAPRIWAWLKTRMTRP